MAMASGCGREEGALGPGGENAPGDGGAGSQVVGRVLSSTGEPVANADVEAASRDDPAKPTPMIGVLTNGRGRYSWPLQAGKWEITVSARGHRPTAETVEVAGGQTVTLDFELETAP